MRRRFQTSKAILSSDEEVPAWGLPGGADRATSLDFVGCLCAVSFQNIVTALVRVRRGRWCTICDSFWPEWNGSPRLLLSSTGGCVMPGTGHILDQTVRKGGKPMLGVTTANEL